MKEEASHLAILCDPQGMVVQVLQNDFALPDAAPGRLFPRLVESASRIKALDFLSEIRTNASARGWELNISLQAIPTVLQFFGARVDGRILIVGALQTTDAERLYVNLLRGRGALQQEPPNAPQGPSSEPALNMYDQISHLNNELVAMQRELARQNAKLERLNRLKNQFVGMAAHDLRNPLGVINTYSELLLDPSGQDVSAAEQADFLEQIRTLSQYMLGMVNDLLSVSAIEAGQLTLDLHPLDLPGLVGRNVQRQQLLAASKRIDIILEMDALPPFLLDAAKIEQVLDNLISNAVKFSSPGAAVRVGLYREEDHARIVVQDHGAGISPEDMENLFKPFGRARAKPTSGERSTGLGLVIVKRIVEKHRGTISMESRVGEGTTILVSLPLKAKGNQE